jgi:hypothetical protein
VKKKTKAMIVLGSAVAAVLCFAGVAYAADDAAPGDTLYGLDCSLEDIGIGDGGLQERLTEASELVEDGQVQEGLELAAGALAEEEQDEDDDGQLEDGTSRSEALLAAAEAVLSSGSEQSLEVRTRVAEKLRFMATTELTGKEFGQAVSDLARGISSEEEQGEDDASEGTSRGKSGESHGKANGHSK